MAQDEFDISCLRGIATDPDARRIALAVAMIKMTALSMARRSPDLRDDALEIIDQARRLFGSLPTRDSIAALVDDHAGTGAARSGGVRGPRTRDALVDALWRHFQDGRTSHDR